MSFKPSTDSLAEWIRRRRTGSPTAPLGITIAQGLRDAILQGVVRAGDRLPASRDFAQQLGVARNTVMAAYTQLQVEGFVVSGQGSGTYVCKVVPEHLSGQALRTPSNDNTVSTPPRLSNRGLHYSSDPMHSFWIEQPFCPGLFSEDLFPLAAWNRVLTQTVRDLGGQVLRSGPPGGAAALRDAIVRHVRATRGVRCEAQQVIITDGTAQSLTLIGKLLTDTGAPVWTEDPCYWGASRALAALGLHPQGLAVDAEGALVPPEPAPEQEAPRLAYLTPSNQFPTGAVMSIERREQWLAYARTHGVLLLEDDYDSEFRFNGEPYPALQGMDADTGSGNSVIYLGGFSKTMFPGIRLGFIVVPTRLAELFGAAGADFDRDGDQLLQTTMGRFISEGNYASHVRLLRQEYGARREALVRSLYEALPACMAPDSRLRLLGGPRGVHLTLGFPADVDDQRVARACAERGVTLIPLSMYGVGRSHSGAVLSYTGPTAQEIPALIQRIAPVLCALVLGIPP